jgi:hypothetical protein
MLLGTGAPVAGGRKGGVCLDSVWRHDSFDRATAFVALLVVFVFDSNNRIQRLSGLEQKTLQPLDNPFGTRLSPMS